MTVWVNLLPLTCLFLTIFHKEKYPPLSSLSITIISINKTTSSTDFVVVVVVVCVLFVFA